MTADKTKKTMVPTMVPAVAFLFYIILFPTAQCANDSRYAKTKQQEISEETDTNQTITITIPQAKINTHIQALDTFQSISINGFGQLEQIGKPSLPAKRYLLSVPAGKNATVTILESAFTEVSNSKVIPAQKPTIDGNETQCTDFSFDTAFYKQDKWFPETIAEIVDVQTYKNTKLANVQIVACQNNPATSVTRLYSYIKILVSFTDSQPDTSTTIQATSLRLNRSATTSSTVAVDKDATTSSNADYLIVTTNLFSQVADSLALWKEQLGHTTRIITSNTWTPVQITDSIYIAYSNSSPKPEYVAFIGDNEHIPGETRLSPDNNAFLSDLHYVCMNGTSDYYPDMAHGRISVANASQALSVVQKIINYERFPVQQQSFYTKGINCAQFQDDDDDSYSDRRFVLTNEEIRDYLTDDQGFTVQRIYSAPATATPRYWNKGKYANGESIPAELLKSNDFDWNSSSSDVADAWNNGALYVTHRGHGYTNGSGWHSPRFTSASVPLLSNGDLLPIVFSIDCHSGQFQFGECFAESMLRCQTGGAAGVFGASYESYSGYNDALLVGMFDALWSDPGIVPYFTGSSGTKYPSVSQHDNILSLGDVLNHGLLRMVSTWGGSTEAIRYEFELFHYFGDPAMKMWTREPEIINALFVSELQCGSSSFSISNCSCTDAMATLTHQGSVFAKTELSSGSGILYFTQITDNATPLTLVLSKANHRPFIATIPVTGNCPKPPVAQFSVNETQTCANSTVQFTDSSLPKATAWDWSFVPNTIAFVEGSDPQSQNPKIQFLEAGHYVATLTATNQYGSDDTTSTAIISVTSTSPTIVASKSGIPNTETVSFSATLACTSSDILYAWNFGEGAIPTTAESAGPHTVSYQSEGNKTVSLTVNGTTTTKENAVTVFEANNVPFVEDFENISNWIANGKTNGWSNSSSGQFLWQPCNGPTSTANTGPDTDHTLESEQGTFLYTEASYPAKTGDTAYLTSPYISIGNAQLPELSFWYQMHGQNIVSLSIDINSGFGWNKNIFEIHGQQQESSSAPWEKASIDLTKYKQKTIRVRFRTQRGSYHYNDIAIDDICISDNAPMSIASATFVQQNGTVFLGRENQHIATVQIMAEGNKDPISIETLTILAGETNSLSAIDSVKIFYSEDTAFTPNAQLFGTGIFSQDSIASISGKMELSPGTTNFFIVFCIGYASTAIGSISDAECTIISTNAGNIKLSQTSSNAQKTVVQAPPVRWTWMVYLDEEHSGTSKLEDINELESVGSVPDSVAYLVLYNSTTDSNDGLYYIEKSIGTSIGSIQQKKIATDFGTNPNMLQKQTLKDFMQWCALVYPAEHYGLILGTGNSGIFGPLRSDNVELSVQNIDDAVSAFRDETGQRIAIAGFDAPRMAQYECVRNLQGSTDFIVASQGSIPQQNWDYRSPFEILNANPSISPESLAKTVVDTYVTSYTTDSQGSENVALTAVRSAMVPNLTQALDQFAEKLTDCLPEHKEILLACIAETWGRNTEQADIGHMCQIIASAQSLPTDVRQSANSTLDAYNQTILLELQNGTFTPQASGFGIWLTEHYWQQEQLREYYQDTTNGLAMAHTAWNSFLQSIYAPEPISYKSSTVVPSAEKNVVAGMFSIPLGALAVEAKGNMGSLETDSIVLTITGTVPVLDIDSIGLYATGRDATFSTSQPLAKCPVLQAGTIRIPIAMALENGTNYLWLAIDLSSTAAQGNDISLSVNAFSAEGTSYVPENSDTRMQVSIVRKITIAPDSEDARLPIDPNYDYTYSQSLYAPHEFPAGMLVTSMQFEWNGDDSWTDSITIYAGNTSKNAFGSESDWVGAETLRPIYSGPLSVDNNAWTTVHLDTPFAFPSDSTLVIAVEENNEGNHSCKGFFQCSATPNATSLVAYSNIRPISPLPSTQGTEKKYRPNIKFDFEPLVPMTIENIECWQEPATFVQPGGTSIPALLIALKTEGNIEQKTMQRISFSALGTTNLDDIAKAHLYTTNRSPLFDNPIEIGQIYSIDSLYFSIETDWLLSREIQYFWLAFDCNSPASNGNRIDMNCVSVTANGKEYPYTGKEPVGALFIQQHATTPIFSTQATTLCSGDSVSVGNKTISEAGIFVDSLIAKNGLDSLSIIYVQEASAYLFAGSEHLCATDSTEFFGQWINQPGLYEQHYTTIEGCDSSYILDIKTEELAHKSMHRTACFGDTIMGYSASGTYTFLDAGLDTCPVEITLSLTVLPQFQSETHILLCQGESYLGHQTDTTITKYLTSHEGCDSTSTLAIHLLDTIAVFDTISLCYGESLDGYSANGDYVHRSTSSDGCDSTVYTHVVSLPQIATNLDTVFCDGGAVNGHTRTGTYTDTLASISGCDSICTSTIVVLPSPSIFDTVTICNGEQFNDYHYSGDYTEHHISHLGCDSIYHLNVTVLPDPSRIEKRKICTESSYNGHQTSGMYTDTAMSASGCDSIYTLYLTVVDTIREYQQVAICAGESYKGYSISGTYTDTSVSAYGCDSIYTLQLEVHQPAEHQQEITICQGQSLLGHTTSGQYTDTLLGTNGCDSIIHTSLTVLPAPLISDTITICQGEAYRGHSATGIYTDSSYSDQGCLEIRTLNLTVKPRLFTQEKMSICNGETFRGKTEDFLFHDTLASTYGCDSIVFTTLSVLPQINHSVTAEICKGNSYEGYNTTGAHTDTLAAVSGCDSIRTIFLTVHDIRKQEQNLTICHGETFLGHTASGHYTDTLQSAMGCDSIVSTTLTVRNATLASDTVAICQGEVFEGHTQAGTYTDSLHSRFGCDSIRTTVLIIHPSSIAEQTSTICSGQSHNGHFSTGMHTDTLQTVNGCDSIVFLDLNVMPKTESKLAVSLCEGDQYDGYSAPGTYTDTLLSACGCDSVRTVVIAMLQKFESFDTVSVCSGESYNGRKTSGNYSDTLTATSGCDSIYHLALTILQKKSTTQKIHICPGEEYDGFSKAGTYTDTTASASGCDSVSTLILELGSAYKQDISVELQEGKQYMHHSNAGVYTDSLVSASGCDSIVRVTISIASAITQSIQPQRHNFWAHPTISRSSVVVYSTMVDHGQLHIKLFSENGILAWSGDVNTERGEAVINVAPLSSGIYFLQVYEHGILIGNEQIVRE